MIRLTTILCLALSTPGVLVAEGAGYSPEPATAASPSSRLFLETRADGKLGPLLWKATEKISLRLEVPQFHAQAARSSLNTTVSVSAPHIEATQARWLQEIKVEHQGKTYRADFTLLVSDAGAAGQKGIRINGELKPRESLPFDLTVRQVIGVNGLSECEAILPQRDGKLSHYPISQKQPTRAFWMLGRGVEPVGQQLALPLIGLRTIGSGSEVVSFATDPYLGSQWHMSKVSQPAGAVSIELASTFKGSLTPISTETRVVQIGAHGDTTNALFNTFYQTIPDIQPGPAWIHDIQLNHYDYIAETGKSLEPDLNELAKRIPEKYRKHVIVCLHGYYDYLGRYCFNANTGRMDDAWNAYDNHARLLPMTKAELHRRIRLVKDRGFRCAIYYFDALAYEDATKEFNPQWVWRDANATPRKWYYWQKRPDSKGHSNFLLNPAHPEVRQWFLNYTKALIAEYGRDLDALVWDETFVRQGSTAKLGSNMVEADRAMMQLVAAVTRQVQTSRTMNPNLAILTSDNVDAHKPDQSVPYGLVAHGTYQDSWCDPKAWSPGRLPNHRNCLISCNWWPIKNRDWNRIAAEEYGLPQGVSNGFGDDRGPSEMPKEILDEIVARFIKRVEAAGKR